MNLEDEAMRQLKCQLRLFLFLSLLSIINISPAFAYIDPGTGSMLLQGIIGAIAAGIAFLSMYYNKIKTYIRELLRSKNGNTPLKKKEKLRSKKTNRKPNKKEN